jgi:hypothetical protein
MGDYAGKPGKGYAKVLEINAQLIFRRAFIDIARQKGWNDPDILMEQNRITVP